MNAGSVMMKPKKLTMHVKAGRTLLMHEDGRYSLCDNLPSRPVLEDVVCRLARA